MTKTFVSALALTAAVLGASHALAADLYKNGGMKDPILPVGVDPILNANNQFAIQFVTTNFDYLETDPICYPGRKCDAETGWVPGFGAELSVMSNFMVPNFYFNVAFSYVTGETDYTGAYQGGSYGSLVTKSGADVYDIDARLGKGFFLAPSFMATPYLGVGYHEWDRGVNAGELYSHAYVGGGLLLQWAPTNRLVVFANGLVGSTFNSNISVSGAYGFDAALQDSLLWKVGGGVDYAITPAWHASAKAELTEFEYGKSAIQPTGYYEPDSQTSNLTVKAGFGYSWGGSYTPLK